MIIIGCDFHTRFQQIAMLDTETGEVVEKRLEHEDEEAKRFYAGIEPSALVGIESTGYSLWFAEMLQELGHELAVGDAAKIRASETRKQKHDRRDAWHILELLAEGKFPRLWLPSVEEREVRVLLEHRHQLVQMRTRAKNGLQAVALNHGLRCRRRLWTEAGLKRLQGLSVGEGTQRRREDLLRLLQQLDTWVEELDERLQAEVGRRPAAQRLMTHPGVGPLTALATVLILGEVERFSEVRQVTSYVGLIPAEESSGGRQRFGHLTKQGNRLLRFLLVEAGQSASREDPGLRRTYKRLTFRKGKSIAKVAIARKLVIRLYIMLRDKIDYPEFCRRGSHAGMLGEVALA
jgi:transposase